MKKLFIITGVLAMMSLFSSCQDSLDQTPDGKLTLDEVFADTELTEKYMSNCYNNLPRKSRRYFWFENYPTALSDESYSPEDVNGQGPILVYKGQASAVLNPIDHEYHNLFDCRYWERYWASIRYCNVMLAHVETCAINKESDRSRWRGEIHTLRAYFYLQLMKWYGAVPIVTEELPFDYDYSQTVKSTCLDVLKFIVSECDEALKEPELPWRLTNENERNRMTKAIAHAIRSQASLYAASTLYNEGQDLWDWAYQINKDCLQQLRDHGYALYTERTQMEKGKYCYNCAYAEYFAQSGSVATDPLDKETIWQQLDMNEEFYYWVWGTPQHACYKTGDSPSQQLVDAYDMLATGKPIYDLRKPYLDETCLEPNIDPTSGYNDAKPYNGRDPRMEATVIYDGLKVRIGDKEEAIQTYVGGASELNFISQTNTRTGYYPRKGAYYKTSAQSPGADGRWKYYRLAEVILNLAECAVEVNKLDEAMELVNEIRHRAGFDPSVDVATSDKEYARLLVRHERQVEFAYEEHRYFDMRRWTRADEPIQNEKYLVGMKITKKGVKKTYERFLVGSDGTTPSKMNYEPKWHFLPIPADEAAKLQTLTGVNWQNEGW